MAHQTGIQASPELKEVLTNALKGKTRLLKVSIKDETLIPDAEINPNKDWEGDYDDMVPGLIEEKNPCYMFYRLDEKNGSGSYVWIFLAYTPDLALVRDKMLYAATQATMKQIFGGGLIKDDISGSVKEDFTLAGYYKHRDSVDAPPPLTEAEQLLQDIKLSEQTMRTAGTSTRTTHLQGISFPFQQDAVDALKDLQSKQLAYVQLALNIKEESIILAQTEKTLDVGQLPSYVPSDSPRYHVLYFPHDYEGDHFPSFVFIYTCPGYSCSVKERMLYSSCKGPVTDVCEQQFNITIAKKIETDDGAELTRDFLLSEIHPPVTAYRPKFSKPKPPGKTTKRKKSKSPSPDV
ncbi:twinfilin-1-like [Dysidea avara]|uniref:twinfilin-1-like n=1 Tax=Dysidea avara TaxID=196820 RepID=UPI0033315249